jgi:hypothetical protein
LRPRYDLVNQATLDRLGEREDAVDDMLDRSEWDGTSSRTCARRRCGHLDERLDALVAEIEGCAANRASCN